MRSLGDPLCEFMATTVHFSMRREFGFLSIINMRAGSPAGPSNRPGTVRIETRGNTFHLPVSRFDNRDDKTTFVREDRAKWPAESVRVLHAGLREALAHLAGARA